MIKKNSENLLNWVFEHVIDFTDENDTSGLTWESSRQEALRFLRLIPRKEKVQKYGIYPTRMYFIVVDEFDDIKDALEKGFISEDACALIYRWNKQIGRENWDMGDVRATLYPAAGRHISRNFLYSNLKQLIDLGVMECINPEVETGRLYRLTEKGERILFTNI